MTSTCWHAFNKVPAGRRVHAALVRLLRISGQIHGSLPEQDTQPCAAGVRAFATPHSQPLSQSSISRVKDANYFSLSHCKAMVDQLGCPGAGVAAASHGRASSTQTCRTSSSTEVEGETSRLRAAAAPANQACWCAAAHRAQKWAAFSRLPTEPARAARTARGLKQCTSPGSHPVHSCTLEAATMCVWGWAGAVSPMEARAGAGCTGSVMNAAGRGVQ